MKLHRATQGRGCYMVTNTALLIYRSRGAGDMWCVILGGGDAQDPDVRAWWQRNPEVRHARFDTLREAREYLQAVMGVDPCPKKQTAQLSRRRTGDYTVRVAQNEARATLTANGRWQLRHADGTDLGCFHTLARLRHRAPELLYQHMTRI